MRKALISTVATAAVASVFALPAVPANATSLDSGCGTTVFTSCSETDHFSQLNQWLGGSPAPADCPSYIGEWALASGTGNGVVHNNFNKDGDAWFTTTWSGDATITFYPSSSVTIVTDDEGNVTSADVHGPADHVLSGHIAEWGGGSFNNSSDVFGFTFNFAGTDESGNPINVHGASHANWTPGSDPNGLPSNSHTSMSCH